MLAAGTAGRMVVSEANACRTAGHLWRCVSVVCASGGPDLPPLLPAEQTPSVPLVVLLLLPCARAPYGGGGPVLGPHDAGAARIGDIVIPPIQTDSKAPSVVSTSLEGPPHGAFVVFSG